MKIPLLLAVTVLLAGEPGSRAADSVELNGISCLGSQNLACFLLFQPTQPEPRSFVLAEGESKYGFTLVAVEASRRRVLVEKCGVKKYVRINSTPDLIATNDPEAVAAVAGDTGHSIPAGADDTRAVDTYLASDAAARILAGHPALPAGVAVVVPGGASSSNNGQGAANGQNSGTGSAADGPAGNPGASSNSGTQAANATADTGTGSGNSNSTTGSSAAAAANNPQNEEWYQESESIEQSRIQTADQVVSGQMEPFPRTPLTPPGTPGQLVGQETYFANSIPGFKETGYLNQ